MTKFFKPTGFKPGDVIVLKNGEKSEIKGGTILPPKIGKSRLLVVVAKQQEPIPFHGRSGEFAIVNSQCPQADPARCGVGSERACVFCVMNLQRKWVCARYTLIRWIVLGQRHKDDQKYIPSETDEHYPECQRGFMPDT